MGESRQGGGAAGGVGGWHPSWGARGGRDDAVGFPGIAIVLPHLKAGRLRALAVTTARRSPQMPQVPSIAEAGVPGYEATLWFGIAAPKGTTKTIIAKLHKRSRRRCGIPKCARVDPQRHRSGGFDAR